MTIHLEEKFDAELLMEDWGPASYIFIPFFLIPFGATTTTRNAYCHCCSDSPQHRASNGYRYRHQDPAEAITNYLEAR